MRTVRCLFLLALAAALAGCSGETVEPRLRQALERRQAELETEDDRLRKRLAETGTLHELPDFLQPLSPAAGDELARVREEAGKLKVTAADQQGLNAYTQGDLDRAERLFQRSAASGGELALYFLGLIAFERGDEPRAAGRFREVVGRNPACRGAALMQRLSELCAGRDDPDAVELAALFDRACVETHERLSLESPRPPELAFFDGIIMPPLTADPVLFKTLELLPPIVVERQRDVVRECLAARDANRRLILALQTGSRDVQDACIQALVRGHPQRADFQMLAFLRRHYTEASGEKRASEEFAADLARMQQMDPNNGAWVLFGIPEKTSEDGLDYLALDDEELARFHRAVRAKRFHCTPWGPNPDKELLADPLRRYGGCTFLVPCVGRRPLAYAPIRHVAQRALKTLEIQLLVKEDEAALTLCEGIETMVARLREDDDTLLAAITGWPILDGLYEKMAPYARETGRTTWLHALLEKRREAHRGQAFARIAIQHVATAMRIPSRRLCEPLVADARADFATRVALRRLEMSGPRYAKQAATELREALDAYPASVPYGALTVLEHTRHAPAEPVLKEAAAHEDRFLAYLAQRALDAIAQGQKP